MIRVAVGLVVALLAILPATARAGSNFFVGFSADAPKGDGAEAVEPARSLGAKSLRLTLQWQPGTTVLSVEDIAGIDRAVGAARDMRVVVAVYGTPKNAPLTEIARDQYCSYVSNLVSLFPAVRDVIIWNEPNLSYFWKPQFNPDGTSASPTAYEALLARCWDVLHAYDSGVNVVGFATSPHGTDNPAGPVDISLGAVTFIRRVGEVYRASGRQRPIFDTFAQHAYGATGAERPWRMHPWAPHLSEGDYSRLVATIAEAFSGTRQPLPGECSGDRCVSIWYTEAGFQTTIDETKASLYDGAENVVHTVPDDVGGEPALPTPSVTSPAPDQSTQIGYAVRLAYCQPFVEAFFNFLLWDEQDLARWQSGPFWADRTPKDSYPAFKQVIDDANSNKISCAAPTTPPGFRVATGSTSATLAWGPSSSNIGVSGYRIFRAGQFLAETAEPGYVVKNLADGTTPTYTVRAFDAAGKVSAVTGGDGVSPPSLLTVVKGGRGMGTVRSESAPRIDCGTTCSGTAYGGAVVTLTASADAGSVFTGWSGSCSGKGECVVAMTEDRLVKATFAKSAVVAASLAPLRKHLTVRVVGGGRILSSPSGLNCGHSCAADFDHGTAVVLVAKPASGWRFFNWGDPCARAGTPASCVLRLEADTSVTATFRRPGCVVPRVVGKSLRAARAALARARCRIGKVRRMYSRRATRGRVVSETPRAGTRMLRGSKVNLVLSRGRRLLKVLG